MESKYNLSKNYQSKTINSGSRKSSILLQRRMELMLKIFFLLKALIQMRPLINVLRYVRRNHAQKGNQNKCKRYICLPGTVSPTSKMNFG